MKKRAQKHQTAGAPQAPDTPAAHPGRDTAPEQVKMAQRYYIALRSDGKKMIPDHETLGLTLAHVHEFIEAIDRHSREAYRQEHPVVAIAECALTLSKVQVRPVQPKGETAPASPASPAPTQAQPAMGGDAPVKGTVPARKKRAVSPPAERITAVSAEMSQRVDEVLTRSAGKAKEAATAAKAATQTAAKADAKATEKIARKKTLTGLPVAALRKIAVKYWGMDAEAAQTATVDMLADHIVAGEFTKTATAA